MHDVYCTIVDVPFKRDDMFGWKMWLISNSHSRWSPVVCVTTRLYPDTRFLFVPVAATALLVCPCSHLHFPSHLLIVTQTRHHQNLAFDPFPEAEGEGTPALIRFKRLQGCMSERHGIDGEDESAGVGVRRMGLRS